MSRLIALDYAIGRRIDIRGVAYRIDDLSRRGSRIKLKLEKDGGQSLVLTFDQLATLLVQGDAELIDELDDPRPAEHPERSFNNIAQFDMHRLIDWVVKAFLLRHMSVYMGAGPKSEKFQKAFDEGCRLLKLWFAGIGLDDVPLQTAWTTYQDQLRWRRRRYSLAALGVKALEYRPWRKRGVHYVLAEALAKEVVYKNPAFSAASIHEAVNDRLKQ